jgi:hypothetical protein
MSGEDFMAQIFISHSSKDKKPIEFLNRAFASSNIQAKYEEIEAITHGAPRNSGQIKLDIAASNAIFVVLGTNAEKLKHTRDWMAWETGAAEGGNKDVWVLEASEDTPQLSIVIPRLRHYVCFQYTDMWLGYLRSVVQSYDDSHIFKLAALGAGAGAAIGESPVGALIGGGLALLLAANVQTRPTGLPIVCPICRSFYNVHISTPIMRCPVCNNRLQFAQQ